MKYKIFLLTTMDGSKYLLYESNNFSKAYIKYQKLKFKYLKINPRIKIEMIVKI